MPEVLSERVPRLAHARVLFRMAITAKELQPNIGAVLFDVTADPLLTAESVAVPCDPVHMIDLELVSVCQAAVGAMPAENFDQGRA